MTSRADLAYLAERLRDALVHDPGVGEQDLHVEISGDHLLLTGCLTTADRHRAVLDAVARLLPGAAVKDELRVVPIAAAPNVERVP